MRWNLFFMLIVFSATPMEAVADLRVVATIPDFAELAREIGGERVSVKALVKGGQDPHFADAKPSMVLEVNKADLLVVNGLALESGWLPVLLKQARNSRVQPGGDGYLDASTLITPLEVPARPDRAMGDVHPGGNPHYFTSPVELLKVAEGIRNKLISLDPQNKAEYMANWSAFKEKFAAKIKQWKHALAPLKGEGVVVYHKSWIYFLQWSGLKEVGALEPKPGIPPSPSHVIKLLKQTRNQGVKFVIQEIYQKRRLSRLFAKKAGARLVILPSMVGALPGTETVCDKFDKIVELLTHGNGK